MLNQKQTTYSALNWWLENLEKVAFPTFLLTPTAQDCAKKFVIILKK